MNSPAGRGGVEDGGGIENPLDPDERRGGGFPELFAQRGEFVAVAAAVQEFVVEMAAQPAQRGRYRGLAQAQLFGGPGDVAFGEQRVERRQEVEIQVSQRAGCHTSNHKRRGW